MDTAIDLAAALPPRAATRSPRWVRWPRTGIGWTFLMATALVVLLAAFYAVEDWRGKHAWKVCREAIETKGGTVNWSAFIPPPVRNDENFFAAPKMSDWFVGRGANDLSGRLDFRNFNSFYHQRTTNLLVEVTVIGPAETVRPFADIILDYDAPFLSEGPAEVDPAATAPPVEFIPQITYQDVPLEDAIQSLARQAGLHCTIDPGTIPRPPKAQPVVTFRWENLTARQAFFKLLNEQKLKCWLGPKNSTVRVAKKSGNDHQVQFVGLPQIQQLLQAVTDPATWPAPGLSTLSPLSSPIVVNPAKVVRPVRMFIRAAVPPTTTELLEFFPPDIFPNRLVVEASGTNTFTVRLNGPLRLTASDYLAWSDPFETDFDTIREALKRPFARMDGNYESSATVPVPNFVCVRVLAQTLSQRAQCHLLVGDPDAALRDVTLLHDLARLLEGRTPNWTKRPMTLVAAMINVAVTGLYVNTIEDGLRLQAWPEPALAAIQRQLQEVNLVPLVSAAFETERAGSCHLFETSTPAEFARYFANGSTDPLKNPLYISLKLAPRGWVYQNMVTAASLQGSALAIFDFEHGQLRPSLAQRSIQEAEAAGRTRSPYSDLAMLMVPNFSRAVQALARQQTFVNEALIVCALERYQIQHHQYPASLADLVADFAQSFPSDLIGGGPLKYRRTNDGKFTLYSIGWNEQDDGGVAGKAKDSPFDLAQGDWVWPYREQLMR